MGKEITKMQFLKELFEIKKPSILLLVLPYLLFYWREIYHSIFYSHLQMALYLTILLLLQWLALKLYDSKILIWNLLLTSILTAFIIFWYGIHVVNIINDLEIKHFKFQVIRGRSVLVAFSLLWLILENYRFIYQKNWYYFQNNFLVIFSGCILIFSISHLEKNNLNDIHDFKSQIIPIKRSDTIQKPIILIISDEYSSPDGLAKVFKDSSLYDFSKTLTQNGWIVKNHFYTYNTSTIHSLSSLFNFNLSKDSNYARISIDNIGTENLMKCEFADSLQYKKISILNYGIFDIGNSPPLKRLYYYPKKFSEVLIQNSIFPFLFYNTEGLKLEGLKSSYYPMEEHNKMILNTLEDTLKTRKIEKLFVYAHLYMPHGPMVFTPEFSHKDLTTENYLTYWKFTNKKLLLLLHSLSLYNQYRIILTGDHGYRSYNLINPHYTFTAFFGFEETDINKLYSVQDLGCLINGYF